MKMQYIYIYIGRYFFCYREVIENYKCQQMSFLQYEIRTLETQILFEVHFANEMQHFAIMCDTNIV